MTNYNLPHKSVKGVTVNWHIFKCKTTLFIKQWFVIAGINTKKITNSSFCVLIPTKLQYYRLPGSTRNDPSYRKSITIKHICIQLMHQATDNT